MATTLGGATLADPMAGEEGHRVTAVDVGGEMTMADGSLRVHHVGTRKRFDLRWRGITSAQRDAIYTKYLVKAAQVYSPPESAASYTVVVVRDSWGESSIKEAGGTFYFNCGLVLEEQAAS